MTFKTAAKSFGNGLLTGATILANATTQAEIDKIDAQMHTLREQMTQLQENRDRLSRTLI